MIGILLINLGTPDAPTTTAVRRYLKQFLSDPYVIDIDPIARWLLLNFIILPIRSRRSARQYQTIWRKEGSPLLFYTQKLADAVAKELGGSFAVEVGMRYGSPSIESAVNKLIQKNVSEIRVLPLFPQKAQSSYVSAVEEFQRVIQKISNRSSVNILKPFFDVQGFIDGFVSIGRPLLEEKKPDHVLFSFHGLPKRHVEKWDEDYPIQCRKTAEQIADKLGLDPNRYSVSFQSRLGLTPWIRPYTDKILVDLIRQGKRKFLVFCPAFVADCLETLEEVGVRFRKLALEKGAASLELVPSLNATPLWVQTVSQMLKQD